MSAPRVYASNADRQRAYRARKAAAARRAVKVSAPVAHVIERDYREFESFRALMEANGIVHRKRRREQVAA